MIGSIRQDNTFLQQATMNNVQNNSETFKQNSASRTEKPEISRVQQIKEALAKGEYKIDIGGSAEKMARNLLGK